MKDLVLLKINKHCYLIGPDSQIDELKQKFPEWFADNLAQSRLRKSTAGIHGLTAFIREARNEPDLFPKTNEFLRRINGIPSNENKDSE